jgi:hypothetical protein
MNDTKKSPNSVDTMTRDQPTTCAPGQRVGHQQPAVVSAA